MEKPPVLIFNETEEKIIDIINKSGLPAFILLGIIEKIYNELTKLKEIEIKNAQSNYEQSLTQKKESEE